MPDQKANSEPHSFGSSSPVSATESDSPSLPDDRFDLNILRSIRRIIRAVDIYSRKLRSQCQLTAPQLICLTTVVENGPLTVSQIAHRVFLSPSTVVGVLDRLESRELIHRERDKSDRRVVNILTTDKGRELASSAPSALQDGLAEALKDLPKLEQATIALSLKRVVDLMEAGHLDAAPILETDHPEITTEKDKRTRKGK